MADSQFRVLIRDIATGTVVDRYSIPDRNQEYLDAFNAIWGMGIYQMERDAPPAETPIDSDQAKIEVMIVSPDQMPQSFGRMRRHPPGPPLT